MVLGILAVVVILGLFIMGVYNSLVTLGVRIKEAWSQIDVQLKRRTDLIPNLVETVKGYASHEKEVFEKVTQARAALMSASSPKEAGEADQMLGGVEKSIDCRAYPELKSSKFLELQKVS